MKYVAGTFLILCSALSGCGQSAQHAASDLAPIAQAAAAEQPELVVYKNASCGCCALWVEHMRKAGFSAKVHDVDNMSPIKERVGVPYSMGSCHTAEVGGYFVEGHVPAEQVVRLLKEKPQAKGLTVPAMPIGSPGMEQGNTQQPYEVHLVKPDGTTSVYARYPKK
ncbi:MAG TPA: DUF411 domain-containing protein [Steroidobacteraceae bacterium]|nr:DUF411 domain-containing protein [Steroidobacteraceae bacterium]